MTLDQMLAEASAAHRRGAVLEADTGYEIVLRAAPDHSEALLQLGVLRAQQGKLDSALPLLRRGIDKNPASVNGLNNLGLVYHQMHRYAEAVACYQAATSLAPKYAVAWNNLGASLGALARHREAVGCFERATGLLPSYAEAFNNLGCALHELGRDAEAVVPFQTALALRPAYVEAAASLARTYRSLDQPEATVAVYEAILAFCPQDATLHLRLGEALVRAQRSAEALASYRQAIALRPDLADAHAGLGFMWQVTGDIDEARRCFERAIALDPTQPAHYRGLVSNGTMSADDPHWIGLMELEADVADLDDTKAVQLHFAMGKALADVGRPAEAFDHIVRGNTLHRRRVTYDEAEELRSLEAIGAMFTPAFMAERRTCAIQTALPIFIVGMPRSGSTLIEQILASHPDVVAGGELRALGEIVKAASQPTASRFPQAAAGWTSEDWRDIGLRYLSHLDSLVPEGRRPWRVTDKKLDNFRMLGLIRLLFPGARIVHARRDPVECCLSAYGLLFDKLEFSYDLGELGRRYRAYDRLMAHWRAVLPTGAVLDVQYEEMVGDTEAQIRRLLDHCGLDWHPACLDFHATQRPVQTASVVQVRQPIYRRSLKKWRPPESVLAPLRVIGQV